MGYAPLDPPVSELDAAMRFHVEQVLGWKIYVNSTLGSSHDINFAVGRGWSAGKKMKADDDHFLSCPFITVHFRPWDLNYASVAWGANHRRAGKDDEFLDVTEFPLIQRIEEAVKKAHQAWKEEMAAQRR